MTIHLVFLTGDVFYITSMSGNWTADITDLPTTTSRSYGIVFILEQGNTPYYINELKIGGTSNTILWPDATAPTPTASRTEVESFTLYYSVSSNWTVLGQYSSFGDPH